MAAQPFLVAAHLHTKQYMQHLYFKKVIYSHKQRHSQRNRTAKVNEKYHVARIHNWAF